MWIICQDDLHEMPNLIVSQNINKKNMTFWVFEKKKKRENKALH